LDDTLQLGQLPFVIGSQPKVILDVGANDGGTSAAFQRLFPSAFIHAFEPDPRAIHNCRERINSQNIDQTRFNLHEVAVANFNGTADYYPSNGYNSEFRWYDTGYDLAGSLNKPLKVKYPGIETIYFESPIRVPVRRIDDLLRPYKIETIDLIWMDVQGGESNALLGAIETVSKACYLYIECIDEMIYEEQQSLPFIETILSGHIRVASYKDGNHLFQRK
jgi:FkbM family methyltransferase